MVLSAFLVIHSFQMCGLLGLFLNRVKDLFGSNLITVFLSHASSNLFVSKKSIEESNFPLFSGDVCSSC